MHALLLHDGRFGAAVTARLAAMFPGATSASLDDVGDDDPRIAAADVVLAASWRRRRRALDRLDAACHRAKVRWSSAVLDGTSLTIGPLVVPEAGPCFACFWRRYLAHARTPAWEVALASAYDEDPSRGPAGFCPAAVGMAAAALAADARAAESSAGRVVRASLLGGDFLATRVVKVHDCVRCGARARSMPGERFVRDLVPRLEEMFAP